MATIAARAPYYITQNTTALQIRIKSYAVIDPGWQHEINKASYSGGNEDLTVDVSPYIRPYFVQTPQANPSNITTVNTGSYLNVVIEVNGVEETHRAVEGYIEPLDESYYDTWQTVKPIHNNTNLQLNLPPGIYNVYWATSDGQTAQETTTSATSPHQVRVHNTSLDLSTANWVTVSTDLHTYKYDIVCPYQEGTIGFINDIGMWEYFDINGRQDLSYTRQSQQYIPYNVGEKRNVYARGSKSIRVNTGWVDEEFGRVIEACMESRQHIWHYGTTWDYLILNTNSLRRQRRVTDKMMNYTLDFEISKPTIPLTTVSAELSSTQIGI